MYVCVCGCVRYVDVLLCVGLCISDLCVCNLMQCVQVCLSDIVCGCGCVSSVYVYIVHVLYRPCAAVKSFRRGCTDAGGKRGVTVLSSVGVFLVVVGCVCDAIRHERCVE